MVLSHKHFVQQLDYFFPLIGQLCFWHLSPVTATISNCQLCGKELIYLKHYQKPYAVTKKSTKEIFLLCNCQSGIHILNKLRRNIILLKNGEENGCFWPTPLFRVVLKNNFCYLGAG